jgi:TonB family protein
MRKRIEFVGIGLLILVFAGSFTVAAAQDVKLRAEKCEFKLRVLEGIREGAAEPAKVVTSSYLRYMLSADLQSKEESDEAMQIKKTFNLKDVKLLTEANLNLEKGARENVSHTFRLDGKSYLVRLRGGGDLTVKSREKLSASQRFGIEVFELNGSEKTSLLETEFAVTNLKNVAVFGFEDSQGKPYFISLSQTDAIFGGVEGGVSGGVEGGVEGGVLGGVEGGVTGGVEGGVLGSVEGGVAGNVQSQEVEKKLQEFRKDAVAVKGELKPPKLIKKVDPVYPDEARKKGVQGTVILEAKIDESGKVMDAMVLRSIPDLDQAAIDAITQWVYEPMLINGKPVKALFTVTVRFKLDEKDIEKFAEGAVKVKDQISPPKLVKIVEPVYPEIARQSKVEGIVIVQARTDTQGRVKDAMILRSIPLLDQAALDAVKQWAYEPMVINGEAKEAVFTVTVRFALDKEKNKGQQGKEEGTGDVLVPTLVKRVDPVYPEAAAKAGIQGIVLLEATTDEQGNVVKVRVLKSIPELDQAAIDALKQWKYEPFIVEGKPKGVVFTVTIRFALK